MAARRSARRRFWAGFDLGGTKMLACIYDERFREVGRARARTRGIEGASLGLSRVRDTLCEALAAAQAAPRNLAGIGIGCPGPLDMDRGILLAAPNLPWSRAPLKRTLERQFGCPVAACNDVDAGVYGESLFGAGRGARCVVGVFPGTGVGGGCVYEGQILRGRSNSIFEIGHCQVLPDGPLCGCGRRGCLEAVASRLAIAAAAAAAVFRGEAPHLQEIAGTDVSRIRSRALALSIKAGDRSVERIVRNAARWLGAGVALTVNLIGPDVVVLGGGLVEAMPRLFLEEVRTSARDRVMPAFRDTFRVVRARLGDDATVMGAAAWARTVAGGRRRR